VPIVTSEGGRPSQRAPRPAGWRSPIPPRRRRGSPSPSAAPAACPPAPLPCLSPENVLVHIPSFLLYSTGCSLRLKPGPLVRQPPAVVTYHRLPLVSGGVRPGGTPPGHPAVRRPPAGMCHQEDRNRPLRYARRPGGGPMGTHRSENEANASGVFMRCFGRAEIEPVSVCFFPAGGGSLSLSARGSVCCRGPRRGVERGFRVHHRSRRHPPRQCGGRRTGRRSPGEPPC